MVEFTLGTYDIRLRRLVARRRNKEITSEDFILLSKRFTEMAEYAIAQEMQEQQA